MQTMYYIGLDVHKRKISYCVKDPSGAIHSEGSISATRFDLDRWMKTLPQPWRAAIEATMFTGWIYDHLKPHAAALKVAHPLMLRAIAAAKKKKLALCSMLGFSEEELRGTHSVDFPEDASKDQALFQQLRAVITRHQRKGGAALFPT